MTNVIGGVLSLTGVIIIDLTTDQTNLSKIKIGSNFKKP